MVLLSSHEWPVCSLEFQPWALKDCILRPRCTRSRFWPVKRDQVPRGRGADFTVIAVFPVGIVAVIAGDITAAVGGQDGAAQVVAVEIAQDAVLALVDDLDR